MITKEFVEQLDTMRAELEDRAMATKEIAEARLASALAKRMYGVLSEYYGNGRFGKMEPGWDEPHYEGYVERAR